MVEHLTDRVIILEARTEVLKELILILMNTLIENKTLKAEDLRFMHKILENLK